MKIKDIRVHIINAPIDTPFKYSQRWVYDRSSVLIEVETADGTVGWGECLCHGGQYPQMAAAIVEHCYKPLTIGRGCRHLPARSVLRRRLHRMQKAVRPRAGL